MRPSAALRNARLAGPGQTQEAMRRRRLSSITRAPCRSVMAPPGHLESNLPSGGQGADIEIGAFLIGAGNEPEKQELLRLIRTLVEKFLAFLRRSAPSAGSIPQA
jgi:hypothetical protein